MTSRALLEGWRSSRGLRAFGRWSAWVEIAVFFAIALGWDATVGAGTRFSGASPHPFWVIVLLMSGFYGLREGMTAAVVAALVFRTGNLPPQQIDQHVYDYAWSVLREPLLWILAAAVLGEIRRQHARAAQRVAADLEVARARLDELGEAYRRLDSVRDRLETRVASQATTAVQLYKAVQAADRLDAQGVLTTIAEVIRTTLDPEAFSLFLMHGESLECVLREGWPTDATWPTRYVVDSPLFDAIVAGRRPLCVAQAADQAVLAGDGLLAGPLVDMRTGELVGMLKVERMRFLDLNFSSVQAFRALCEWIATAYQNAQRFEEARADRLADQDTHLYSATYLERQRAYLAAMAERFGFDLTLLVLRIEGFDDFTPDERVGVAAAISRAVRTALRRTDMAFDYRRDLGEVAVLMPGTPLTNAYVVASKLEQAIDVQLSRPLRISTWTRLIHAADAGGEIARTAGPPAAVGEDAGPAVDEVA